MTQKRSFDTRWMLVLALLLCLGMLGITTRVTAGDGGGGDLDQLEVASPAGLTPAEWEDIQSQIAAESEFAPDRSSHATYPIQYHVDSWSHKHQVKLTSPDPASWDRFGYSVAVAGDTAVVGVPGDDDGGAVYVFRRVGEAWSQEAKLTPDDLGAVSQFGHSVALSEDTAVIAALSDDNSGRVYVYVRSGTAWSQQATLATASDATALALLGYRVAVSGDTVVIGAPHENYFAGSAYVFARSGTTWSQQVKLTSGPAIRYFGYSVAISGDTAVIGAPESTHTFHPYDPFCGGAFVYVRNGPTWSYQAELWASDLDGEDHFGSSVAMFEDVIVIGAPHDDDGGFATGSAYVFVPSAGGWRQQAKLTASDATEVDWFGYSVAVSDDTAVIGAPHDDDGGNASGSAYVFARSGTTWSPQAKLTASDAATEHMFGKSVAVAGDSIVIGAPEDVNHRETDGGAAYAFDLSTLEATQPVTIGVAASLSGNDLQNQYGWQQLNSVQLAVSQTNEAGGILVDGLYYTLTLVMADSACDPTQAFTAAHDLLDAGSVAIVGHTCSFASHAGAPIYNAAGVAMVTPSSTDPTLTQQGYTTIFRTTGHIGTGCAVMAKYFYSLGRFRTAILRRDDTWSEPASRAYSRVYEALGGTITSQRIVSTTGNIENALVAIQAENVDLILVTDPYGRLVGEVSRAALGMGMLQPIASLLPWDEYIDEYAGPEAAEGDYAPNDEKRPVDMPGYVPFEAAYLAAGFPNEPVPGGFSSNAYDAAMIIIDAIQRAGTPTDTLAIRDAVAATTDYAGVTGTYERYEANGDVVPQWSRIDVVLGGEWVPAWLPGEFYPDLGGTFDLDGALGTETTLEIPPEPEPGPLAVARAPLAATAESLRTSYAILMTTTLAADSSLTMMGGRGLHLEANRSLATAVTLTVAYDDSDVDGIREDTLGLYAWDGSRWLDAEPCGGYVRDADNNVLQAVICELGDYAILGKHQWVVQLPLVLRSAP